MYYSIDLIKPLFNSIYNIFTADMTTATKKAQILIEVKKAVLMIKGFENFANEATPQQAQTDLKTVNDLLIKFSGMFQTLPKGHELKSELNFVIERLNEVKKSFEKFIDRKEDEAFSRYMNKMSLERYPDENYSELEKMPYLKR
jgi:hypothetical protein